MYEISPFLSGTADPIADETTEPKPQHGTLRNGESASSDEKNSSV
jgi:hypothetical protein